jgi:hypothetical protein
MELLRVVVKLAEGAPELLLADLVAPIAPDPLVPDRFTPVNVTTVNEDGAERESVAVTETLESRADANALQISVVPL